MNELFCNVLIFGAGIMGSSLALKLAQSGIKVIIINDKPFIESNNNLIPNVRVSAINYTSVKFFKSINVWKNISKQFRTPYHCMKTWEYPCAMVTFNAQSIGLSKMGCIVENHRLQLALWNNILDSKIIKLYCSYKLISLEYHDVFWKCILEQNIIINSQLLIGADGTNSQIREKLGIGVTGWQYNQCCMLLTIKTEKDTAGTIWQVFRPNGPIGFLPLYDHWGSLMWFDTPQCIYRLKHLPKLTLIQKIEREFHKQFGKLVLHNVTSMSLINQQANRYIALGGVLIGDAAHTIHPLAGQGINLGIRDVIDLSKLLSSKNFFDTNQSISYDMLLPYQNSRKFDICVLQSSINYLYFIFHNNIFPLKLTRNIAFMTVEKISFIKKRILQYAVLGI